MYEPVLHELLRGQNFLVSMTALQFEAYDSHMRQGVPVSPCYVTLMGMLVGCR